MNKYKTMFFSILLFGNIHGNAQNAITSSGGNVSGSGGFVSYSLGQVFYAKIKGATGSFAQGVQSGLIISAVGLNEESALNISLSAFPNPTEGMLILQADNLENQRLKYRLSDEQGKLIESNILTACQTQISMNGIPSGTYIINVIQKNHVLKTFKIIKK